MVSEAISSGDRVGNESVQGGILHENKCDVGLRLECNVEPDMWDWQVPMDLGKLKLVLTVECSPEKLIAGLDFNEGLSMH